MRFRVIKTWRYCTRLCKFTIEASIGWPVKHSCCFKKYASFIKNTFRSVKTWTRVGRTWERSGKTWARVGRTCECFGRNWECIGRTWGCVGRTWTRVGGTGERFGRTWECFGRTWTRVGRTRACVGRTWDCIGRCWKRFGGTWERFDRTWGRAAESATPLVKSKSPAVQSIDHASVGWIRMEQLSIHSAPFVDTQFCHVVENNEGVVRCTNEKWIRTCQCLSGYNNRDIYSFQNSLK